MFAHSNVQFLTSVLLIHPLLSLPQKQAAKEKVYCIFKIYSLYNPHPNPLILFFFSMLELGRGIMVSYVALIVVNRSPFIAMCLLGQVNL